MEEKHGSMAQVIVIRSLLWSSYCNFQMSALEWAQSHVWIIYSLLFPYIARKIEASPRITFLIILRSTKAISSHWTTQLPRGLCIARDYMELHLVYRENSDGSLLSGHSPGHFIGQKQGQWLLLQEGREGEQGRYAAEKRWVYRRWAERPPTEQKRMH